jgi:tRNA threonylcarbamoyl adenosine modification protein YeaZ
MYQLLLDSSNKYLSVGLSKDGKVVDSIFYDAWQRQSEMMTVEIENILKRNNLSKEDLDAVVVGIGPGSYTGVRIGITIAKTIGYALKIKVYKVSSLALLRIEDKPTICVFNARSGRSYYGVYQGDKTLLEDTVGPNEDLLKYIEEHKDYLLSGDVENLGFESAKFDIISNLAKGYKKENEVKDIFTLNPVYLKELGK